MTKNIYKDTQSKLILMFSSIFLFCDDSIQLFNKKKKKNNRSAGQMQKLKDGLLERHGFMLDSSHCVLIQRVSKCDKFFF